MAGGGMLAGKVALVTGAAAGIGRAIVACMCREGASVFAADIDEEGLVETCRLAGRDAVPLELDVTSEASWQTALRMVHDRHGALHVLVNNAARRTPMTIGQTDLVAWRSAQEVTAEGVFLGMKLASERMVQGGAIVNVASIAAFVGEPRSFPYSAAKGAVRAMTRSAALQFAASAPSIRVNLVAPGATLTDAVREQAGKLAAAESIDQAEMLLRLSGNVPLGRFANPIEIAEVVTFVASDRASFMTGAEILVDGGATAR